MRSLRTRPFTVEEFHRMAEAHILSADDRVELIDGEVVPMTPIGPRHAACVRHLNRLLSTRLSSDILLDVQSPLLLHQYGEVYPDLMLLRPRLDEYVNNNPQPSDVLLLIEVADTSFQVDQHQRIPRYAGAGIHEVWLVNLSNDQILIYQNPRESRYSDVFEVGRTGTLRPQALPHVMITADEILGQPGGL